VTSRNYLPIVQEPGHPPAAEHELFALSPARKGDNVEPTPSWLLTPRR